MKLQSKVPDWGVPYFKPLRYKGLKGGRSSGKSWFFAELLVLSHVSDKNTQSVCVREVLKSIKFSAKKLIEDKIRALNVSHLFDITQNEIRRIGGSGIIVFQGLQDHNADSIKSLEGFDRCWVEEASTISERSLEILLPTIRSPKSEIWFSWNPFTPDDPVEKLFNQKADNMMLTHVNYYQNPFCPDEILEEATRHKKNSPGSYGHVWLGDHANTIENNLIHAKWFDACVDAHKKLGFKTNGAIIAAHDPSDLGGDSKGYCMRHGSIVMSIEEKLAGDVNEGCDWATGLAIQHGVDQYTYDVGGMGIALARQTDKSFQGKKTTVVMFNGAESVDFPDVIYEPSVDSMVMSQKKNKEIFKNKRAQYYFMLRDRIYRTYRAVEHNEYSDPDALISFDSSIKLINKLRSELCRIPIKPNSNGMLELYRKEDMKRLFNIKSPNLADSAMMCGRFVNQVKPRAVIPRPLKTMR